MVGKFFRKFTCGALVLVLVFVNASVSQAGAGGTSVVQVQGAIASVPELLADSDEVSSGGNSRSVALTSVNGTQVDIPKDAGSGVRITTKNEAGSPVGLKVNLPGANAAGVGKATAPGVVAFPSATVSANAVQADENGGVRFFQVLNGPTAPEEFQYTLELPQGSSIVKEVNGSLTVHTSDGDFIVPTPWARDADGRMVWAQYFTDGESTIDLVVNHHGEDLAYPVTADPVWLTPWIVAQIIRCGAGALLGWISSGGWDWWWRALAVAGGCLIGMR